MGAAAVQLNVPVTLHLCLSAVLFTVFSVIAYRFLLPEAEPESAEVPLVAVTDRGVRAKSSLAKYGVLAALAIIASAGAIVDNFALRFGLLIVQASPILCLRTKSSCRAFRHRRAVPGR
jgi:hypothetical protein